MKLVKFGMESMSKMYEGIDEISRAVESTLGPKGLNVAYYNSNAGTTTTTDGVTVARQIQFSDQWKDIGADMIRKIAGKTNDDAGDGTTTAVAIAHAIIRGGIPLLAAGLDPVEIKNGIEIATKEVSTKLVEYTYKIKTKDEIKQIAKISSQHDDIADCLADIFDKIGSNSSITIEDSSVPGISYHIVEGYEANYGYLHEDFANDGAKCVLDRGVKVLVTDYDVTSIYDFITPSTLLKEMADKGLKNLCIVSPKFGGDALLTFRVNHKQQKMNFSLLSISGIRSHVEGILKDIAIVTGANFISISNNKKLSDAKLSDLGSCDKVESTRDKTLLVGTKGKPEEINHRIELLKSEKEVVRSEYEKEKIDERIARINGGVCVISIGSYTEDDRKHRKDKLEDAKNACRASIEEGFVPGGGATLAKIAKSMQSTFENISRNSGYKLMKEAIEYPLSKICSNGGYREQVILENIQNNDEKTFGFDANTGTYCDLIERGIIDPVRVTRSAVLNAATSAGLMLRTATTITFEPKSSSNNES
jgi:chaperonin GroEL